MVARHRPVGLGQPDATVSLGLGPMLAAVQLRIGLLDGIGRAPSGCRRFRGEDLEWLGVLRLPARHCMPIAQMRRNAEPARRGQATVT